MGERHPAGDRQAQGAPQDRGERRGGQAGDQARPGVAEVGPGDADDVLVVVATGGAPVEELGELPVNARAAAFLPYDALFPRLDTEDGVVVEVSGDADAAR